MGKRAIEILCLGVLTAFIVCCDRDLGNQSKLNFNLSSLTGDNSSLNIEKEINFLAINVTGSGGRTICSIDPPRNGNSQPRWNGPCRALSTEPLIVEVENLRTGSGQRVQILAIVREKDTVAGTEQEYFNYGDEIANIGPGDNVVDIVMSRAPQATNKDSNAVGRYQEANGSYYTGKVALQFTPPANAKVREPMTIFNLEIFDGWFNVPLLDNVDITYLRERDGKVLFNQPVNLGLPVFQPSNGNVLRLDAPETFYDDNGGTESDEARSYVIGFWNDGQIDNSKTLCYDTTSFDGTEYISDGLSIPVNWPSNFTIDGGTTSCGNYFDVGEQTIAVNGESMIDPDGGGALFYGPYSKFYTTFNSEYSIFDLTIVGGAGGEPEISWKYLPGVVGAGKITGTTVFYATAGYPSEFEGRINDGGPQEFDCNRLAAAGFQRAVANGTTQKARLTGVTADVFNTGKVVMCPRISSNQYFTSVVDLSSNGDISGCTSNCGSGNSPATKLVLFDLPDGSNHPYYNANACTPVNIVALNDSNEEGSLPSYPYGVTLTASSGTFYTNQNCSIPVSGSISISNSHALVFFNYSTTGSVNVAVSTDGFESVTLSASTRTITMNNNAVSSITITPAFPRIYDTECSGHYIYAADTNGVPANNTLSGNITLSAQGPSGSAGQFHLAGNCGGATISSVFLPAAVEVADIVEFLPNPVSTDTTITISGSDSMGWGDLNYIDTVVDAQDAEYAVIEGGSPSQFVCSQFRIASYWSDSSVGGYPVRATPASNITFSLSTTGLGDSNFFSDGSCSVSAGSVTLLNGNTDTYFWFRTNDSPSSNFNFDFTASPDSSFDIDDGRQVQ
ncbi:MAG: hypothetical protein HRT45_01205 [Bdellovibrionales bacterium]|nr:hypothetical protein [Bdellovibrionales bacterium]